MVIKYCLAGMVPDFNLLFFNVIVCCVVRANSKCSVVEVSEQLKLPEKKLF